MQRRRAKSPAILATPPPRPVRAQDPRGDRFPWAPGRDLPPRRAPPPRSGGAELPRWLPRCAVLGAIGVCTHAASSSAPPTTTGGALTSRLLGGAAAAALGAAVLSDPGAVAPELVPRGPDWTWSDAGGTWAPPSAALCEETGERAPVFVLLMPGRGRSALHFLRSGGE